MNLTRTWWVLGFVLVFIAAILCLIPLEFEPKAFRFNDKIGHLAGHAAMAAYFAGLVPRSRWLRIFAFLLLFGITVEFAQYYMNVGRNGDIRDVAANALGALLGLVAARLGLARWPELAGWLLGQRSEAR
jgi:VanZ family protein